ncbi:hypothetical protein LEP1GSC041_0282 [Leptospira noguchii str. 2006001870]|nr:hypothetical protein LEP1GSC041_0282 [Leptospira noguchii str. 2006001870]
MIHSKFFWDRFKISSFFIFEMVVKPPFYAKNLIGGRTAFFWNFIEIFFSHLA